MDKNKVLTALISILLSAIASFIGNVGAGRASNDPVVVREAIEAGIKAGLTQSLPQRDQSQRAPFQGAIAMPTIAVTATDK